MVKLTTCYFCDYGSYYGNKDETTSYPIYEIPEAWRYIKFASLVNFRIGKTPPRSEATFWGTEIPWVSNFLAKYNDIALLADLMGHESIETTRIYLRKTATEQQNIVDKIVNW
ncbi:putative type I restriction-modification system S protein [Streptococcus pneumoniae]|nr:putative type I restriction-modification system S protein [Streptococcus pneumoniae]